MWCCVFQPTEEMASNCPSLAVMVNDLQTYLDRTIGLAGTDPMPLTELSAKFGSFAAFKDISLQSLITHQVL